MPTRVNSDGASGVWHIEFWKSVGVRETHRGLGVTARLVGRGLGLSKGVCR
jgi:hypothetical protein